VAAGTTRPALKALATETLDELLATVDRIFDEAEPMPAGFGERVEDEVSISTGGTSHAGR
jgi:hypothetical protein